MSELYRLPDEWEWKTIDSVCDKITDGAHKSPKTYDEGMPYITVKDVDNKGNIDFVFCKKIKQEDYDSLVKGNCKPFKGDVLFSKDGTVGKVSLINYEKDFVVLSSLAILRPSSKIKSEYLAKYLKSPFFYEKAIKSKTGAAIKRVVLRTIKSLDIPLPPLQEQKRIVSKLDTLFEKIDKAIALHQKNMDEADVFMGSILNEVFGELEERYATEALGNLTTTTSGGTPKRNEKSYWGGTIGWLKSGELNNGYVTEVQEFITEVGLKKSSAKLFPKGTLLIAMYGATVGKLAILDIETTTNQAICGVLNDKGLFETKYMFYFFQKSKEKMLLDSTGGAQPNISQTYLKQLQVVLPPLETQQKTVKYLDQISEKTEKVKSVQIEKMASLKALKASLLDKAFRGEL